MKFFNKKKLNILILGSDGMLGNDIYNLLQWESQDKITFINNVIGLNRTQLDLFDIVNSFSGLYDYFEQHHHYDVCINCIAMTDTVSAETTENGKNLSYKLNAQFLNHLATVCKIFKTKLIHISTDYVFSELCNPCINIDTHSYLYGFSPVDIPFPKNNYGLHKLLGEQFIQNIMHKNTYAILRTSWLYGQHNEKSFVHKFLKNALKCCKENILIDVTHNEYSIPTSTIFLSYYIYGVINQSLYNGIIHACPLSDKLISRYDFACEIARIYNKLIEDNPSKSNETLNKIPLENINSIERNNKIQPTYSQMMSTHINIVTPKYYNMSCSWKKYLEVFMTSNFEQLRRIQ